MAEDQVERSDEVYYDNDGSLPGRYKTLARPSKPPRCDRKAVLLFYFMPYYLLALMQCNTDNTERCDFLHIDEALKLRHRRPFLLSHSLGKVNSLPLNTSTKRLNTCILSERLDISGSNSPPPWLSL